MQREFNISLSQEFYSDTVYLSQYDSEYNIVFHVKNRYAAASVDGLTATFTGIRPDGLGFEFASTGVANDVTFAIDNTISAVAGTGTGEIVFTNSDDMVFGSANVQIIVEPAAHPNDTIDADVEEEQALADEIRGMIDEIGTPTDAQVETAVNAWLDAHPEATTTVQDNSLTSAKLKHAKIPFYNVTDFGVTPNSGDVYSALYDLIANYVYNTGGIVYFPAGKYTLSDSIFVPENTTFMGAGDDTEIYFDETYTNLGVGLCNAGSNVTIKNMKLSQASTGTFPTGSQPGCLGFSDIAKSQCVAGKHVHTYARAEVHNLTAENLTFDGFYAIGVENTPNYEMHNITYKNLVCPESCVSFRAKNKIDNVKIENIICDLFRILVNNDDENGFYENVSIDNVKCQTLYLGNQNYDGCGIIGRNIVMTSDTRHNSYIASGYACAGINGNVDLSNCVFTSISSEQNGVSVAKGIRKFTDCVFNMYDKIITRNSAMSDTDNYEIMTRCEFNSALDTNTSVLLGYGSDNKNNTLITAKSLLWGDIWHEYTDANHAPAVATTKHPNRFVVRGKTVRWQALGTFSSTGNVVAVPTALQSLPINFDNMLVTIWNQDGTTISSVLPTYVANDNNTLKATYPSLSSSAYNRYLFDVILELTREPKPTEIFAAFNY